MAKTGLVVPAGRQDQATESRGGTPLPPLLRRSIAASANNITENLRTLARRRAGHFRCIALLMSVERESTAESG